MATASKLVTIRFPDPQPAWETLLIRRATTSADGRFDGLADTLRRAGKALLTTG